MANFNMFTINISRAATLPKNPGFLKKLFEEFKMAAIEASYDIGMENIKLYHIYFHVNFKMAALDIRNNSESQNTTLWLLSRFSLIRLTILEIAMDNIL